MREHKLDARALEPPEPFVLACAILQEMKQGECLRMRHRRIPYPLFDFCDNHHLCYRIIHQDDNECELLIYFDVDTDVLNADGAFR